MKLYIVDLFGSGLIEVVNATRKSDKSYWVETQNPFSGKPIIKKHSLDTQYDKAFVSLSDAIECLIDNRENKVKQAEEILSEQKARLQKAQTFIAGLKKAQEQKTKNYIFAER